MKEEALNLTKLPFPSPELLVGVHSCFDSPGSQRFGNFLWFFSSSCWRPASPGCPPHLTGKTKQPSLKWDSRRRREEKWVFFINIWVLHLEWSLCTAAGRRWRVEPDSPAVCRWSPRRTARSSSGPNRKRRSRSELCPEPRLTAPPVGSPPARQKNGGQFSGFPFSRTFNTFLILTHKISAYGEWEHLWLFTVVDLGAILGPFISYLF